MNNAMQHPSFDWEIFGQFGLGGLILGVFFLILVFVLNQHAATVRSIVNRMSSDHKESNDSWRQTFVEHSNRADARQMETNSVLRDLTQVMNDANARNNKEFFQNVRPQSQNNSGNS